MNPSILRGYAYDLAGIGEQSGGAGGNGGGGGSIAGSSYNFTGASGGSGIIIICNHRE